MSGSTLKTFLILVIVLLFRPSVCNNTFSSLYEEVDMSSRILNNKAGHAYKVVNKIYNSFRTWFFTVTFCEFTYFENNVLKYTQTMDYGYPVLLLNRCPTKNKTKEKPKINIHGETAYIITSEVLTLEGSEDVVDSMINTGLFKPRNPVIFVLNDYNRITKLDSYFFYNMKTHFRFLWSKSISTSVVILLWNDTLKTFSYDHVHQSVQDISNVKDVSSLLAHENDNLYGRELRLSVFKKISAYDDLGPIRCDSKLAQTIIKEFNATCKPLGPRDTNTVGDILSNGSATGVTADLIDGYTDLELNSRILKNSYYGYIDTTYPLMQDELCFLVKSADKQSTFKTTIKMISLTILSIFIIIVISLILTALLAREIEIRTLNIEQQETRATVIFDLLKCFIRQTVNIKFNGPVYRAIVLLIILYSLIVDCIIDGIITSAITNPRYKSEINTLEDLFDSNLTLGIHNRHFNLFDKSLEAYRPRKLTNRIERIHDRKTKEIITKRNFQYALLLRQSEALNICRKPSNIQNGRPIYQVVSECPIPCFIVYGLRYGSPYLPKLNQIMHYLNQGGILSFWLKSEQYKIFRNMLKSNDPRSLFKKLNITNFYEVFFLWMIGLVISTVVFVTELLVFWWKHSRKHSK